MPPPKSTRRNERPPHRAFGNKQCGRHARTRLRPGTAALPVRARPRALRYDSTPCHHPNQPAATNGRPIALSETSNVAATLAHLCGRGRPRSLGVRGHVTFFFQGGSTASAEETGRYAPNFWNVDQNRALSPPSPREKSNQEKQGESRSIKVNQGQSSQVRPFIF